MKNCLVSIIVPVYKVEKYLDRCLNSIVNQTYKNLEIILVDDGSPDNCPAMCDEWAKKDSRIKVIHKENDGLSNARNSGIEICNGDYVMFVDSDDYIAFDMVEYLLRLALDNQAEVSRCGFYTVFEEDNTQTAPDFDASVKNYDYNERMIDLLNGSHISGVAWNKLYKSEVIKAHPYKKEDGCSEDILHNFRVYLDVEKTAFCDEPKYYYVIRKDSITNSEFGEGAFDIIRAKETIIDELKNDEALFPYAVRSFVISAFVVLTGCIRNNYYNNFDSLIQKLLSYYKMIMVNPVFSKSIKLKVFILKHFKKIYILLIKRKYSV